MAKSICDGCEHTGKFKTQDPMIEAGFRLVMCRKCANKHARRVAKLERAIVWALGLDKSGFRGREDGEGAYWWRTELDRRAGGVGNRLVRRNLRENDKRRGRK